MVFRTNAVVKLIKIYLNEPKRQNIEKLYVAVYRNRANELFIAFLSVSIFVSTDLP